MLNLFLVSCILGFVAAVASDVIGYVWRDGDVLVHDISNYGDSLAHSECGEDCADSQTVDMTENKTCHGSCRCKADHIKRNLHLGIFGRYYLRQLSREKIRRDDRKPTSVGQCDSDTYQNVTYHKVEDSPRQCSWEDSDPHLMDIQHLAKYESNYEAAQILWYEFLPHDHERQYQCALEYVCPGSESQSWKNQRKCVWHAGYCRYSRCRIEHENHSEAVDGDCCYQGDLAPHVMQM